MENNELHPNFKKNPFKVPEGYFESFDKEVMNKIYHPKQSLGVWVNYKKWMVAAGVAMTIGLSALLYNNSNDSDFNLASTDVDSLELANYTNDVDVSEDEFMDIVDEEAVDSLYREEIILKVNTVNYSETEQIELLDEEYSPLDDEIEI
ncbi:MAG: hypothetical protein V4613_05145 [Bacteroidota bacterium]